MTPVDKEMVITWYCEVCNQLFRILEDILQNKYFKKFRKIQSLFAIKLQGLILQFY